MSGFRKKIQIFFNFRGLGAPRIKNGLLHIGTLWGPFTRPGMWVQKVKKIKKSQKCPKTIKNGFWYKFGAKKACFRVFLTPGPKLAIFEKLGILGSKKGHFKVSFRPFWSIFDPN